MIELKLLTDDEDIKSICELYWAIGSDSHFEFSVREIANLVHLSTSQILKLVRDNCVAYVPNWQCENCGELIVCSNRTDFSEKQGYWDRQSSSRYPFVCAECKRKHEEDERKVREIEREKLREKIKQTYDLSKRLIIDIDQISFHDIIYLFSILRGGLYEDLSKIKPLAMFEQALSPTDAFTHEIVEHLFAKKLIYVHPDNEPEVFPEIHANIFSFYTYYVYYAPPVFSANPDNSTDVLKRLYAKINSSWLEGWYNEAYEMWRRIALEECLEYLLFVLNEHHFKFNPGKKTRQYLEFALNSFSIAQTFNIIWRVARDAAACYQRGSISKMKVVNSAIASIQRFSARAIAEGWDLKPYNRHFGCPQSIVSEVLFDTALKIGEKGFRLSPSLELVKLREEKLRGCL